MGYMDMDVPTAKDPTDYTYHERRAELLRFVIEAGHPDMISRTRFADRYDVAHSQISRDIKKLRDEIREELNGDAEFITSVVYRKAIREKADNEDWMEAAQLLESWNEWLFQTGQQERAPEKMEMDLDASVERTERKAFVGVDLTSFEGIDPDNMVGLDLDDIEVTEDGNGDEVAVPVEGTDDDSGGGQ